VSGDTTRDYSKYLCPYKKEHWNELGEWHFKNLSDRISVAFRGGMILHNQKPVTITLAIIFMPMMGLRPDEKTEQLAVLDDDVALVERYVAEQLANRTFEVAEEGIQVIHPALYFVPDDMKQDLKKFFEGQGIKPAAFLTDTGESEPF